MRLRHLYSYSTPAIINKNYLANRRVTNPYSFSSSGNRMAKMNPTRRTSFLRNLPSILATIAAVLYFSRNDWFAVYGFNTRELFFSSSCQRYTNNHHHRKQCCCAKSRRQKTLSGDHHSVEKEQQNGSLPSTITSLRAKSTANDE